MMSVPETGDRPGSIVRALSGDCSLETWIASPPKSG